jgi:hypothetical protein
MAEASSAIVTHPIATKTRRHEITTDLFVCFVPSWLIVGSARIRVRVEHSCLARDAILLPARDPSPVSFGHASPWTMACVASASASRRRLVSPAAAAAGPLSREVAIRENTAESRDRPPAVRREEIHIPQIVRIVADREFGEHGAAVERRGGAINRGRQRVSRGKSQKGGLARRFIT